MPPKKWQNLGFSPHRQKALVMKLSDDGSVLELVSDNDITENGDFIFPDSVTRIGINAFYNCKTLTNINIPICVTNVGYNAFQDCSHLVQVTIQQGIVKISRELFKGCTSLNQVILPEGVREIGSDAFAGCSALKQIVIPKTVKIIGVGAFYCCTSLTLINLPMGLAEISPLAFFGCHKLIQVTIPRTVTRIKHGVLMACLNLAQVTIPETVFEIEYHAFENCNNLKAILIEADLNTEVERLKYLLNPKIQGKVIKKSTYDEKINNALSVLIQEPKINPMYKWNDYLNPCLPEDILTKINSFLGDDSVFYKKAKVTMMQVSLPDNTSNLDMYKNRLVDVAIKYRKAVNEYVMPSIKQQFYVAKHQKWYFNLFFLYLKYQFIPLVLKYLKEIMHPSIVKSNNSGSVSSIKNNTQCLSLVKHIALGTIVGITAYQGLIFFSASLPENENNEFNPTPIQH